MSSILLLSGGIDSLVLLADECNADRKPRLCVSFSYGQKHARELWSALIIAQQYLVKHLIVRLPREAFARSSLTSGILSTDSTDRPASLSETVVPARNLAMLSVAVSLAVRHRCSEVLFAAHQGDSAVYPDCRPGFVRALNEVTGPTYGVQIRAPYLTVSKAALVAWGKQLDAPLHVAWSCYEGGEKACGNCGACRARREAGA